MIARCWSGFVVAAAAAVLIFASACGGKTDPPTGGGTAGPAGTTQSLPAEHSAAPRTKRQLTSALLTVEDLPPGFRVSPPGRQTNSDDITGDPGCRKASATDAALDSGTLPDQVAHAAIVFSKSEDLRGGDQSMSSFKTEAAAKKVFSEFVAAADVCHSFGVETGVTTTILTGKSRSQTRPPASSPEWLVHSDHPCPRVAGSAWTRPERVGSDPDHDRRRPADDSPGLPLTEADVL